MFEELKKIEIQGKEYPIKCDLLVLEKLQQEFGSLNDFENGLITMEEIEEEKNNEEEVEDLEQQLQRELGVEPEEKKEEPGKKKYKIKFPDMKCVTSALYYMINEGEEIEAEKQGRVPVIHTREELGRKVGVAVIRIANQLHAEFYRCFFTEANPEKKQEETQSQKTPEKQN